MPPRYEWQARHFSKTPVTLADAVEAALDAANDSEMYMARLHICRHERQEVFDTALALCGSEDPTRRRLGVDVLCPISRHSPALADRAVEVLIGLLDHDHDVGVLYSIGHALGALRDPRAIGPLAKLKDHPDPEVRKGVALGLFGHEDDIAVRTLIELSADDSSAVRDWAVGGIGTGSDIDTPVVRDALVATLTDDSDDVRAEALLALAWRGDTRVVEPLRDELLQQQSEPFEWDRMKHLSIEAAQVIGDPRLHGALVGLRRWWGHDSELLEAAIARCAPSE